jgi:hypothetical protein
MRRRSIRGRLLALLEKGAPGVPQEREPSPGALALRH